MAVKAKKSCHKVGPCMDVYLKHRDFNLTSTPSVSHLKEETAKLQLSTGANPEINQRGWLFYWF